MIVLQSCAYAHRPHERPEWLERCQASVRRWAEARGYEHRLEGDELFERNPSWLNDKLKGRGPIKSDVARLLWARELLEASEGGARRVLWLDADVLIFDPERFTPLEHYLSSEQARAAGALFGRERWVQPHKKGLRYGWRTFSSLCNALCLFERGSVVLPFYLYTAEQMIRAVDPRFIAPQMIGPKLLSALNTISPLPHTRQLGSASPDVLIDLAKGAEASERGALAHLCDELERDEPQRDEPQPQPQHKGEALSALNLCASLINSEGASGERLTEQVMLRAIEALEGGVLRS